MLERAMARAKKEIHASSPVSWQAEEPVLQLQGRELQGLKPD